MCERLRNMKVWEKLVNSNNPVADRLLQMPCERIRDFFERKQINLSEFERILIMMGLNLLEEKQTDELDKKVVLDLRDRVGDCDWNPPETS